MKKLLVLYFIILITSFTCFAQDFSDSFTTSEGYKLQATAKPLKETLMLGETTYIVFEINNLSNQKLYTRVGGDYRNNIGRPDSYSVKVVREDGKSVPQPKVTLWMGGLIGNAEISAEKKFQEIFYLPHWATFEDPGTYTITISRAFSIDKENNSGGFFEKPKVVFYAQTSTKIKIIPTNKEELGKVIDGLGITMLGGKVSGKTVLENSEEYAARLLKFIDDKRVIIYFAQALEIYSKNNNWRFTYGGLAQSLSKFEDDIALDTLKKLVNNKNDDLRLDVAEALMYSRHPQALKVLLQMQDDSYSFVRLRVLQAYGEVNSDEADALLNKMVKDENEYVRGQAKELLEKRKQKNKMKVFG